MRTMLGFTGFAVMAAALSLGVPTPVAAQTTPVMETEMEMKDHSMMDKAAMKTVRAKSLAWSAFEVPGFDSGIKLAVVSGDPGASVPYTIRLDFPAGYKFPAHWHPNPENLTVLSGAVFLGMGDTWDDSKLQKFAVGDYFWVDGKNSHFGRVEVATVIQLHGMGPFAIELAKAKK